MQRQRSSAASTACQWLPCRFRYSTPSCSTASCTCWRSGFWSSMTLWTTLSSVSALLSPSLHIKLLLPACVHLLGLHKVPNCPNHAQSLACSPADLVRAPHVSLLWTINVHASMTVKAERVYILRDCSGGQAHNAGQAKAAALCGEQGALCALCQQDHPRRAGSGARRQGNVQVASSLIPDLFC